MPRELTPRDRTGSASIPAGARIGNGTQIVLVSIRVQPGTFLRPTHFGNFVSDVAAFGSPGIQWSLIRDGSPIGDYFRTRDQIGLQNDPRLLPEGIADCFDSFEVWAENDAAAAFVAGASLKAWVFSIE